MAKFEPIMEDPEEVKVDPNTVTSMVANTKPAGKQDLFKLVNKLALQDDEDEETKIAGTRIIGRAPRGPVNPGFTG